MSGRVAVVGGYGTGISVRSPRVPSRGETILAGPAAVGHGGKGSNQAVAASRLGATVSLLTSVGDDGFGAAARRLWAGEGIDDTAVRVSRAATMLGVILVDTDGDNRIIVAPGALDDLDVDDVDRFAPRIEAADVCVVSLEIPVRAAGAALRTALRHGTTTILNPAPPAPLPEDVLRHVDVLTPNRSEAAALTGSDVRADPRILLDRLRDRVDGTVVLTLGPDGALVDDGDRRYHVAADVPHRVVDTTGAGDAFTGALACALAYGVAMGSAVELAAAAGTFAVGIDGVVPALAHRTDLPLAGRLLPAGARPPTVSDGATA